MERVVKKWLGRIMFSVPFVAFFVLMAYEVGFCGAAIPLIIVLAGFAWIIIALKLMFS